MADVAIPIDKAWRISIRTIFSSALFAVVLVHALQLVDLAARGTGRVELFNGSGARSGCSLQPAAGAMAAPSRSSSLAWLATGLLLWTTGQDVEALLHHLVAAGNLAVDVSDFSYVPVVAFPLLLAFPPPRRPSRFNPSSCSMPGW
jgi:hypothetical protein